MKNKKGYTLTEILIVLSILGILTGIATVSYRGYILSVNKRNLKQAGIMFATAVNTCIQNNGGWIIHRYTQGAETCPTGKTEPCIVMTPCKAEQKPTQNNTHAELKSKLSFNCPPDATCKPFAHGNPIRDSWRYYCLSISKEVSGKKLQVIIRVAWHDPSDYQVLCNEITGSYINLSSPTCKKGGPGALKPYGFAKEITKDDGTKVNQIIPCQW